MANSALSAAVLRAISARNVASSLTKKPLLPGYDAKQDLQGGYWNSPSMVTPPAAPIMASHKPNFLPPVQVANQGQDFAPNAHPANDGGIGALLAAFAAPRGHHFGIGGAEISESNPYGNPGGDPFKNGFFKQTPQVPGMMYLGGTAQPDAQQLAMIQATKRQRTMTAPIPLPAGDPQARAFWSSIGV